MQASDGKRVDRIVDQFAERIERLKIGDKLELAVGYADFTSILHEAFLGFRGDKLESIWPILGRGMIQ